VGCSWKRFGGWQIGGLTSGFNVGMNSFCAVLADWRIWRINSWRNSEGGPLLSVFSTKRLWHVDCRTSCDRRRRRGVTDVRGAIVTESRHWPRRPLFCRAYDDVSDVVRQLLIIVSDFFSSVRLHVYVSCYFTAVFVICFDVSNTFATPRSFFSSSRHTL